MKVYFGWSKTTSMPSIYVHLSGRDSDGEIPRSAGIHNTEDVAETSPLRERVCPRCQTKNTGVAAFCQLCGRPFRENGVLPENNELDDLITQVKTLTDLIEKVLKNPKVLNEAVRYVEDLNIRLGEKQQEINEERKRNRLHSVLAFSKLNWT